MKCEEKTYFSAFASEREVSLGNNSFLGGMEYLCERMQKFCDRMQTCFSGERNTFVRERKNVANECNSI